MGSTSPSARASRSRSPSRRPAGRKKKTNLSYWEKLYSRFKAETKEEQDNAFKEATMKDQEIVATAATLIMGFAFGGLTQTPYEQHDTITMAKALKSEGSDDRVVQGYKYWQLVLRCLYVMLTMLAVAFSSLSSLVAMRTSIMLALHPAKDTLRLLESLAQKRDNWWFLRTLYPFKALKFSVVFLLLAVCDYILCEYSHVEFTLSLLLLGLTLIRWFSEDIMHNRAQDELFGLPEQKVD